MFKFSVLGQSRDDVQMVHNSEPLTFKSQGPLNSGVLSVLGQHRFSQILEKGNNFIYLPSTLKISKTKDYEDVMQFRGSQITVNSVVVDSLLMDANSFVLTLNFNSGDDMIADKTIRDLVLNVSQMKILSTIPGVHLEQWFQLGKIYGTVYAQLKSQVHQVPHPMVKATAIKDVIFKFQTFSLEEILAQNLAYKKMENFYKTRKTQLLYSKTKLLLHPVMFQGYQKQTERMYLPTIIIVEYQDVEKQMNTMLTTQQKTVVQQQLFVDQNNKKMHQQSYKPWRTDLPVEVAKALKLLKPRVFLLAPKMRFLIDMVNSTESYSDMVDYFANLKKPVFLNQKGWTADVHDEYISKLRAEILTLDKGGDQTMEDIPIAKIPNFEFISQVTFVYPFLDGQNNYRCTFNLKQKRLTHKTIQTPMLDRFKVTTNNKLSMVSISEQLEKYSSDLSTVNRIILNRDKRVQIKTVLNDNVITQLVISKPRLQLPFELLSIMDTDFFSLRVSIGSSMATSFSNIMTRSYDIDPNKNAKYFAQEIFENFSEFDITSTLLFSPFSWIMVLFGRRTLKNTAHESLRQRLMNTMFPYKFTKRMFSKINQVFYTLTKYKKFATRIESLHQSGTDKSLEKVYQEYSEGYNPEMMLHTTVMLLPLFIQANLGATVLKDEITQMTSDLLSQLENASNSNQGIISLYDDWFTKKLYPLDKMVSDDYLDKLFVKVSGNLIVHKITEALFMQMDISLLSGISMFKNSFTKKYFQVFFHIIIAEYLEYLETLIVFSHIYSSKTFKGISDYNIHSFIQLFAMLASTAFGVRKVQVLQAFTDNANNLNFSTDSQNSTLINVLDEWFTSLTNIFLIVASYIPQVRKHKNKYTRYLIFPNSTNNTLNSLMVHQSFTEKKWSLYGTQKVIEKLLKNTSHLTNLKVDIQTLKSNKNPLIDQKIGFGSQDFIFPPNANQYKDILNTQSQLYQQFLTMIAKEVNQFSTLNQASREVLLLKKQKIKETKALLQIEKKKLEAQKASNPSKKDIDVDMKITSLSNQIDSLQYQDDQIME